MGSVDFDNPKVYGDTSIFDCLVFEQSLWVAICYSQASKTNFRGGPIVGEQIAMIVIVNLKTYRTALAVLSRWGVKLSTLNQFDWVANYDNQDTYVDVVRDA